MIKADSLRAFLTSAVTELADEPSRLQMFVDKGRVVATGTQALAFEYRYTLTLILLDYAGSPDAVFAPILAWLAKNQPELLANFDSQKDAIPFEAEILDDDKVDLSIDLALTECVRCTRKEGGGFDVVHLPEPDLPVEFPWGFNPDGPPAQSMTIYHQGEVVAEWPTS